MMQRVSAIVCAYNEEKTIKPILQVLLAHPKISEVIVVDDGSADSTWRDITSIRNKKLVALHHETNRGKGAAVATAVRKSKKAVLLFIDADLKQFSPQHIDLLLLPLSIDPQGMVIGVRESPSVVDKMFLFMKPFGGERALQRSHTVPLLKKIESSGYGVETIINLSFLQKKRHFYYVPLPGLEHRLKYDKWEIPEALRQTWRESRHLVEQLFDIDNYESSTFQKFLAKLLKK